MAAVLLLAVLSLSILQFPGLDLALPGVKRGGIVEASATAYEELAQETVQLKTAEEMIERGLEPVTEKEGH